MIETTTDNVKKQIAALERMTVGQLQKRYADAFGEPARSGNRQWLLRRVAWRVQALAEGDLATLPVPSGHDDRPPPEWSRGQHLHFRSCRCSSAPIPTTCAPTNDSKRSRAFSLAAFCGCMIDFIAMSPMTRFPRNLPTLALISVPTLALIAAQQLGRCAYLMELDSSACDVIVQRWEKFTGKKAERFSSMPDSMTVAAGAATPHRQ